MEGDKVTDTPVRRGRQGRSPGSKAPRLDTTSTHGTGCTLASAVAVGLAQGMGMGDAVARARAYVRRAIETAPGLGRGHGPLNHAHAVTPFSVKD